MMPSELLGPIRKTSLLPAGMLLATGVVWVFSQLYSIEIIKKSEMIKKSETVADTLPPGWTTQDLVAAESYIKFKKIKDSFTPSGVPPVYGDELNISFGKVQDAINKVRVYGPTYGTEGQKIALEGESLERYKEVGVGIACEYCCGVKTLTKEDGSAACGCAHSIMMRGLAAYLIQNHPNEFNNEQILAELEKWKATYFPKQTLSAKLAEMKNAGEPGIVDIIEQFPDLMPQMVGGC